MWCAIKDKEEKEKSTNVSNLILHKFSSVKVKKKLNSDFYYPVQYSRRKEQCLRGSDALNLFTLILLQQKFNIEFANFGLNEANRRKIIGRLFLASQSRRAHAAQPGFRKWRI